MMLRRATWLLFLSLPCLAILNGCAVVTVTSDPPGAEITYSYTGTPPWRIWPPDVEQPQLTPARKIVRAEPYYLIRVRKDGYHPVRAALADAKFFHRQRLHFDLEPTLELFASLQRERGFVLYNGRWVKPEQEGLVLYEPEERWVTRAEKFRLEHLAKGHVYDKAEGRWVTPEEEERLIATRMRARGLVPLKGRWVLPEEDKVEREIDRLVEQIAASTATFPITIRQEEPEYTTSTYLRVSNISGFSLDVLISGPQSHRIVVDPYDYAATSSLPGTYTVVLREVEAPNKPAAVGTGWLDRRYYYAVTYKSSPADDEFSLKNRPLTTGNEKQQLRESPGDKDASDRRRRPQPGRLR